MSFRELIAIGQEARDIKRQDREKSIVECPICGSVLDIRRDVYNCPMGHYTQRGAQRRPESV